MNLKEECHKINQEVGQKNIIADETNIGTDCIVRESKNESKKTVKKFLTISFKLSDTVTKTLSLESSTEAFTATKKFCSENKINDKLFFSIYKKINSAIQTLLSLPENKDPQLNALLSNTSHIMAKVKRSHSAEAKRVSL